MATSGRSGTRFGPNAIRQISTQLAWEDKRYPWTFALNDKLKVADCGDLVYSFGDNQDMCTKLSAHADALIKKVKTTYSRWRSFHHTATFTRSC